MLQSIPMRIVGANILRQRATLRADGSAVLVRRLSDDKHWKPLPHEELVTADFAFTSEPSFVQAPIERTIGCLTGEVYVCIVDVRLNSPTFGHWQSVCLVEEDARILSIPAGVACGWQVLSEHATLDLRYSREVDAGRLQWLRWDDRDLVIEWPERPLQLAGHRGRSRHLRSLPNHRLPSMPLSAKPERKRVLARESHSTIKSRSPKAKTNAIATEKLSTHASTPSASGVSNSTEDGRTTAAMKTLQREPHAPVRELILVIGSSGQLGRDLCRELRSLGTVIGACRTPDKGSLLPVPVVVDISRPASLRQAIRQVRPTLIVNAAGLADVDQAEMQPRLAQLVNATAPALMADEAKRLGAGLIHFCSSMVFDGTGERPWRETDQPSPQNQYARTKLLGSQAILQSEVGHLILRCGWLYSTHGDNYVRRLIDSFAYRSQITLANDHVGAPTSTNFIACLVADLLARAATKASHEQAGSIAQWLAEHGGLYHASTLGMASKLEVGDQILSTCRGHALPIVCQKLHGRPLNELPSQAKIPANCALDPTRLAMKFNVELPRWQSDLNQQIDLMLGAYSKSLLGVA